MKVSSNSINVTTDLKNLPNGLSSINDSGRHVSIYSSNNMTFSEFQDLLNKIEWK